MAKYELNFRMRGYGFGVSNGAKGAQLMALSPPHFHKDYA
jgi:hypothetical protein